MSRHRMSFAGNYVIASASTQACGWFIELLIMFVWLVFGLGGGLRLVAELVLYPIWPVLETTRDPMIPVAELLALAAWMIVWMATTTVLSTFTGMTLGKVVAGTKVVKRDGTKAGPFRMLLRELVGKGMFIPCIAQILWLVNALLVFGSGEQRGLWDCFAGTMVVERD